MRVTRGLAPAAGVLGALVLEEKTQQLDAAFKQEERKLRDAAAQEQELRWQSLEAELQKMAADKSREMEIQDAKKREEVVEVVVDTYRSL
jgi:Skp family chaperone for outer membrane proteins